MPIPGRINMRPNHGGRCPTDHPPGKQKIQAVAVRLWVHSLNNGSTALCWSLASFFFGFVILYTVGRTPWTGDQPVARPLPTRRTTETQNKCTQTSMLEWDSNPRPPVFKRTKTVDCDLILTNSTKNAWNVCSLVPILKGLTFSVLFL
jgi:hypothetical protein